MEAELVVAGACEELLRKRHLPWCIRTTTIMRRAVMRGMKMPLRRERLRRRKKMTMMTIMSPTARRRRKVKRRQLLARAKRLPSLNPSRRTSLQRPNITSTRRKTSKRRKRTPPQKPNLSGRRPPRIRPAMQSMMPSRAVTATPTMSNSSSWD